ncbi:MAG: hypothetical protein K2N73_01030 [Lachnospiraceae bacterium]|nr:hypothetical protein [Lachnospiraceae bacterium]
MKNRLVRSELGIEVKTGRIEQACQRYGVGRNTMRQIAEDANAVIRIGRNYLIDFPKVDKYIDSLSRNE